jgi:hypothetical protein
MKLSKKIGAFLVSLGVMSGIANAQDVAADNIMKTNGSCPIILSEEMNRQISIEHHINVANNGSFNDAIGVYHASHYSHASHRSHYSSSYPEY